MERKKSRIELEWGNVTTRRRSRGGGGRANDFTSGYIAVAGFHGIETETVAGIDILLHPRVSSKLSIKATCVCVPMPAPALILARKKLDLFLSAAERCGSVDRHFHVFFAGKLVNPSG